MLSDGQSEGSRSPCVLLSPQWQGFLSQFASCEPEMLTVDGLVDDGPKVELWLGRSADGALLHPSYAPYVPLLFQPTKTQSSVRIERQWLEVGQQLVDKVLERGFVGSLRLTPNVSDMKPWSWAGCDVAPRYTYYIDFPFQLEQADHSVRKNINKAGRLGFTARRTDSFSDVFQCLVSTGERQGIGTTCFGGEMGLTLLERAASLLGGEMFRGYVCYAEDGSPASARVVLHLKGGRAIDWVAGTQEAFLRSGATQYLLKFVLDDLESAGADGFDFAGANVQRIARSKLVWGGGLKTNYLVKAPQNHKTEGLAGMKQLAARALRRMARKLDA